MADQFIERVENLIRVVSNVGDEYFNLWSWCDCAIGHAMKDEYFISAGAPELFGPGIRTGHALGEVAKFFDIGVDRAIAIFVPNLNSGYGTRKQVLTAKQISEERPQASSRTSSTLSSICCAIFSSSKTRSTGIFTITVDCILRGARSGAGSCITTLSGPVARRRATLTPSVDFTAGGHGAATVAG